MGDINWGVWVATLIAGGVAGTVLEAVTGWATGWRQRKHESVIQSTEHSHLEADHKAEREHQRVLQTQSLQHEREMKALDRRHERLSRRDANHDGERGRFAKPAADALDWIEFTAGTEYGPSEGDWYPELSGPPELGTPDEVAAAVRGIAMMHPTKAVRAHAAAVHRSLTAHYGSIQADEDGNHTTRTEPSLDQLLEWEQEVQGLLEEIHEPPSDEEARESAADAA